MDLPGVENSLGTRLEFLATDSDDYNARVRNGVFSGMDSNFKGILSQLNNNPFLKPFAQSTLKLFNLSTDIVEFLTPELWEKHQPATYTDLCPSAFQNIKERKHTCSTISKWLLGRSISIQYRYLMSHV